MKIDENSKKIKLRNWVARQRLRMLRGINIVPFPVESGLASVFGIWGVVREGLVGGILYMLLVLIICRLAFVLIGWYDERKIGLWQYELTYQSRTLNPFFNELDMKVNEVNKNVNKLLKKMKK